MSKCYSKLSDAVIMLLALVAHQAAAVTKTQTLRRLVVQDGGSYSGVEDWTEDQALDGNAMSVQSYTVPYSSFGGSPCMGQCFAGGVNAEDDNAIWMIPYNHAHVVRVDKSTGAMTGYQFGGVGTSPITNNMPRFGGGAYDEKRKMLWMYPHEASHIAYLSVAISPPTWLQGGSMGICNSGAGGTTGTSGFPAGYAPGNSWEGGTIDGAFAGSFIQREGGDFLWLAPLYSNMIVRVDISGNGYTASGTQCQVTGYNSWPVGFTPGATNGVSYPGTFAGAVYDPVDVVGLFVPYSASHVVKMILDPVDANFGLQAGFTVWNTWPAGYVDSPTAVGQSFRGGAFDGQCLWMPAARANMIVKVDKTTGAMTGFNNWPPRFLKGGGNSDHFASATYDGKFVWFLPDRATHIIRIEAQTGAMKGFNNFPREYHEGGRSAVLDLSPSGSSLWIPAFGRINNKFVPLLRLSFHTETMEETASRQVPYPGGLVMQDGRGSSGLIPMSQVHTLGETMLSDNSFDIGAAGLGLNSCTNCFMSSVNVGNYIWLIPYEADMVVRVDKVSGASTKYDSFPSEANVPSPGSTSKRFNGAAYDAKRNLIWLIPDNNVDFVSLHVETGVMSYCNNWPGSNRPYEGGKGGSFIDGDHLWVLPFWSAYVYQVNMDDCAQGGYELAPTVPGFGYGTPGSSQPFFGALTDGAGTGFLIPHDASHVIAVTLSSGAMVGFQLSSGLGILTSVGDDAFAGGAFDGQHIWMAPCKANLIVKVDKDTGAMTGYGTGSSYSWPVGFALTGNQDFYSAIFDGKYVWFPHYKASHMIRLDDKTSTMVIIAAAGLTTWAGTSTGAAGISIDFNKNSLWLPPFGGSSSLVLQLIFDYETATPSLLPTPSHPGTPTPEASNTRSHSPLLSASSTQTASHAPSMSSAHTVTSTVNLPIPTTTAVVGTAVAATTTTTAAAASTTAATATATVGSTAATASTTVGFGSAGNGASSVTASAEVAAAQVGAPSESEMASDWLWVIIVCCALVVIAAGVGVGVAVKKSTKAAAQGAESDVEAVASEVYQAAPDPHPPSPVEASIFDDDNTP